MFYEQDPDGSGVSRFRFIYASNVLTIDGTFNSAATVTGTLSWTPTLATWYHFAYVTNGTGNSVYINGVKMTPAYGQGSSSTQAFYSNITTPTYHLLGSSFWSGALQRSFPGQIDDVKIFNYALTPTQVKTDYNDGAVRFE